MRNQKMFLIAISLLTISACSPLERAYRNTLKEGAKSEKYGESNKIYVNKMRDYALQLLAPLPTPIDSTGKKLNTTWVGTVNFNMRTPNFVIIHHTAQNSTDQTLSTFTKEKTKVSSHYVIGRNGDVYQMLPDHFRAWHAGVGSWGRTTNINSQSIGIELDNNGYEPFTKEQIGSLLGLLNELKKKYKIPNANFIGHADIAPGRKVDPSTFFPWKTLSENGFGIWYDENLTPAPKDFSVERALRLIGYNTKGVNGVKKAIVEFKRHFIQSNLSVELSDHEKNILYNLSNK